MTIAKMGLLLSDMIECRMLDAVVSTGALMAHGFVEASGRTHFKYDPSMDDRELYYRGYNRVYDTLELEQNLDDIFHILVPVLETVDPARVLSSREINRLIGAYLLEQGAGRGILQSACKLQVPVYVPAFSDSELGLDFAFLNRQRRAAGKPAFSFDPFLDVDDYADRVRPMRRSAFSPSAAVSRATGRSRSGLIWTTSRNALARAAPSVASPMACESAPSRCTGEGCPAAPIQRVFRGVNSCPQTRAGSSPKSPATPPLPGRCWSRGCRSAWQREPRDVRNRRACVRPYPCLERRADAARLPAQPTATDRKKMALRDCR